MLEKRGFILLMRKGSEASQSQDWWGQRGGPRTGRAAVLVLPSAEGSGQQPSPAVARERTEHQPHSISTSRSPPRALWNGLPKGASEVASSPSAKLQS